MNVGNRVDLYSALAYIASGGLGAASVALSSFVPKYQTQILNISAILIGLSGLLLRLWKNPTTPPPPCPPATTSVPAKE